MKRNLPSWKDKALFTPGPLTTSKTVKHAMLRDIGSRDDEFIDVIKDIRLHLLELANVSEPGFTAVLLPGSGTFGIESVISSIIPDSGKLLVLINGAYGNRIHQIAERLKISTEKMVCAEDEIVLPDDLEILLNEQPSITHLAVVHCETTTGIFNPIMDYARIVKDRNVTLIIDAMSSFGAVPIDVQELGIDFLISSANKNIEGVPGFSFIIANTEELSKTKEFARTLSLDLYAQWQGFENTGQFRFTPPTHALLAFQQALIELQWEGGIQGRATRYKNNYLVTQNAMKELGFKPFLPEQLQGYIISSYLYPDDKSFNFEIFYQLLSDRGFVIYPGKLSLANCFRIGHIGRIGQDDVQALMHAIKDVLIEMNVEIIR